MPTCAEREKKKKRGVNKKMKSKKDTKEKNKLKIYYLINPKLLFWKLFQYGFSNNAIEFFTDSLRSGVIGILILDWLSNFSRSYRRPNLFVSITWSLKKFERSCV